MPKPNADVRSSVVRAMVPLMIGLKSPEPVAITNSARKTSPYADIRPAAKYPAARRLNATRSIRR